MAVRVHQLCVDVRLIVLLYRGCLYYSWSAAWINQYYIVMIWSELGRFLGLVMDKTGVWCGTARLRSPCWFSPVENESYRHS